MTQSPATQFTHVVVTDDQSGRAWRAPHASVRDGLIVIAAPPPPGMFEAAAHTYTIVARDRAERVRRFPNVALAWREGREVAFR